MNKYVVDGTVLFIRTPTGRKIQGFRIPSFKERWSEEDGGNIFGFSTDISFHVPDPVLVEVDEYTFRPATQEEYSEWKAMKPFDRCHSTDVWQSDWRIGTDFMVEGTTLSWKFDPEKFPEERSPEIRKTNLM